MNCHFVYLFLAKAFHQDMNNLHCYDFLPMLRKSIYIYKYFNIYIIELMFIKHYAPNRCL